MAFHHERRAVRPRNYGLCSNTELMKQSWHSQVPNPMNQRNYCCLDQHVPHYPIGKEDSLCLLKSCYSTTPDTSACQDCAG
uniref:Uncharacterized protein n=1 Tax=Rhizophora mucronata TaxID=61149 RepID=A0A2P2QWF2_RHIMU